jgi:hypothetical protein
VSLICGHCKAPLPEGRPNRRYCTAACRTAAYRARKASLKRHRHPSGRQVSLHKAEAYIHAALIDPDDPSSRDLVERVLGALRAALPERQCLERAS